MKNTILYILFCLIGLNVYSQKYKYDIISQGVARGIENVQEGNFQITKSSGSIILDLSNNTYTEIKADGSTLKLNISNSEVGELTGGIKYLMLWCENSNGDGIAVSFITQSTVKYANHVIVNVDERLNIRYDLANNVEY